MKTNTFLYEGETEQKLLKELKLGKARKFNLWEKEVSKIVRGIPKSNTIYS